VTLIDVVGGWERGTERFSRKTVFPLPGRGPNIALREGQSGRQELCWKKTRAMKKKSYGGGVDRE